jgi:hypothetical protein
MVNVLLFDLYDFTKGEHNHDCNETEIAGNGRGLGMDCNGRGLPTGYYYQINEKYTEPGCGCGTGHSGNRR